MDRAKLNAIRHWEERPCGAETADEIEGTPAFFESVAKARYDHYAPWLADAVGFGRFAGARLLEVGCGMGTDLFRFATNGADVVGVDLVPRHLALAQRHFDLSGQRGLLVRADAEHLPFEDASFDVAYSFGVLHHTPNTAMAIAEIYRVLRPGGTAIVAIYNVVSFNLLATLLATAQEGKLFRQSLRETLARIEGPSSATPLVKLHTRWQLRHLLGRFKKTRVTTHHVVGPLADKVIPDRLRPLVARHFGWYLMAESVR